MTDQAPSPEPTMRAPSALIDRLSRSDATSSIHVVWGFFTFAAVISAIGVCFMPGAERRISATLSAPFETDISDIPMRAERMESTESMLTRIDPPAPQQIENDRLLARVKSLEEQLNGITGSISKAPVREAGSTPQGRTGATPSAAQPSPAPVAAAPQNGAPQPVPQATPQPSPVSAPAPFAMPAPAAPTPMQTVPAAPSTTAPVQTATAMPAPSPVTRTSFGLDLGKDVSLGNLRNRWEQLRRKHKSIANLSPQVTIRESGSGVDLHLIVGPYINAADAAKTCAALIAAGTPCEGSLYDGQSLPPG